MELSIEFVCPECSATVQIKLADLAPGRPRLCPDCRSELVLSETGLEVLRKSLPRIFPT